MGKIKQLSLTDADRRELEHGFRHGAKHCFRMRCRAVLLKCAGLSAAKVGEQTAMDSHAVLFWLHRFETEGIGGLQTRPGRGRKPIMDSSDEDAVRRAIEQDRQSVSKAKAAWELSSGKEASESTFKRFLSALAQDISV